MALPEKHATSLPSLWATFDSPRECPRNFTFRKTSRRHNRHRRQWKNREISSSRQAAQLEQSDVVMSNDTVQALTLTAAQQSMSIAIEGFNLFSERTYMLASAIGSGARYAWYHVVS